MWDFTALAADLFVVFLRTGTARIGGFFGIGGSFGFAILRRLSFLTVA